MSELKGRMMTILKYSDREKAQAVVKALEAAEPYSHREPKRPEEEDRSDRSFRVRTIREWHCVEVYTEEFTEESRKKWGNRLPDEITTGFLSIWDWAIRGGQDE